MQLDGLGAAGLGMETVDVLGDEGLHATGSLPVGDEVMPRVGRVLGELAEAPAIELHETRVVVPKGVDGGQLFETTVVGPQAAG
ncbi:hypothetical protein D3C72_752680 [compost metagenome]